MKKLYTTLLLLASFTSFAQLQLSPLPDYAMCDQNADGHAIFDLSAVRQMLYAQYPANSYSVAFYETLSGAESGTGSLPMQYSNIIQGSQVIYAKVWETGNPNNYDITTFQLIINTAPVVSNAILTVCDDNNDEVALFDLTTAEAQITGGMPGFTFSYYHTMAEVEGGMPISDPTSYVSTGPVTTIFVQVQNPEGCSAIALLDLRVNPLPNVSGPFPVINTCPLVNLTINSNLYANYSATYHTTVADAYAGVAAIANPSQYTATTSGSVWIRISNTTTGCFIVMEQAYTIFNPLQVNVIQNGATVTINTNGWTDGFIFTLFSAPPSYAGNVPFSQPSPTFTNLPAGQYSISIQDTCGNLNLIVFNVIAEPVGETEQNFTEGQTLTAFSISGNNIEWYADEPLTQQLPLSTMLADGVTYYATSVTNGNKSIPLAVTARLVAGIDDVSKTMVRLYPNPATSTITLTSQSAIEHIELYSLTGQKVISASPNITTSTIDISKLQTGFYLVKTYSGTNTHVFKILKQ